MRLDELLPQLAVGAAGAWLATGALLGVARRVGWIDRLDAAPDRKDVGGPVPLVGGAAMLLGAALAWLVVGLPGRAWSPAVALEGARFAIGQLAWSGLLAAFVLGTIDDVLPRGLGPFVKLVGQLGVGALVFLQPGAAFADAGTEVRCLVAVGAVVAMNVVNTYDHADGLAGGLGAVALCGPLPALGGAALGYLPFNTVLRGTPDPETDRTPPLAMMGDAGSHLLGVAIATQPAAAVFLVLPALDLLRVAVRRVLRGRPFWVGDRTHVGHRLEGLGVGPVAAAVLLGLAVATPLVARALSAAPGPLIAAIVVTVGTYLAILVLTAEVVEEPGAKAAPERVERGSRPARESPGPFGADSSEIVGGSDAETPLAGARGEGDDAAEGPSAPPAPREDASPTRTPRSPLARPELTGGAPDDVSAGPFAG